MVKNKVTKIQSRKSLARLFKLLKKKKKKVVFTNGCFDLLHLGHIKLFREAKSYGDFLVVAINSDSSLRKLKGITRPLVPESIRAQMIAALEDVDFVTIFSEDTPLRTVEELKPDVLIKGGDYQFNQIVGRDSVRKVVRFPVVKGHSTTSLINKIVKAYKNKR